ncbi:MAG TPA: Pr6Pr family membrane protein [Nakamurella sp.]
MDTAPARTAAPAKRATAGVRVWRGIIAVTAWWGLIDALDGEFAQLKYFSQVTTLTVALAATAGVLAAGVTGRATALAWGRGASTTYAVVTAVIYQMLLSGDLSTTSSLLEHAVVPALAAIDWVVFGPGLRQRWWLPLTWLILPICYLGMYYNLRTSSGRPLYPFLNPDAGGRFWTWVGIMLVVFALAGFVVWAVGLLRSGWPRGRRE